MTLKSELVGQLKKMITEAEADLGSLKRSLVLLEQEPVTRGTPTSSPLGLNVVPAKRKYTQRAQQPEAPPASDTDHRKLPRPGWTAERRARSEASFKKRAQAKKKAAL